MKIKNFEIINGLNVLRKFNDKKLPQKINYAIIKNTMILEKEYSFYSESLNKILNNYDGYIAKDDKDEIILNDNGVPVVDKSVESEFINELNDLLNIEIDVNLYTIPFESFNYDDTLAKYDVLSANDITMLNFLCEEI